MSERQVGLSILVLFGAVVGLALTYGLYWTKTAADEPNSGLTAPPVAIEWHVIDSPVSGSCYEVAAERTSPSSAGRRILGSWPVDCEAPDAD